MAGAENITFQVLALGTLGMSILASTIVLFVYLFQRKLIKRKLAFQKIEDLLKRQEIKTTYALLEGQDKERNRIAKELHDNISSTMVTLGMFLDSFDPKHLDANERQVLDRINNIAAKTAEDTRKLAHSLDSGSLAHFGLKVAITDLVEAVTSTGMNIKLTDQIISAIPGETGLNLYRIIQELVNNTLKHAHASQIDIDITEIKGKHLILIYEDNGIGFNQDKLGMGLRNIKSRVDTLNGNLTIDSKSGHKTTFVLEIPI